MSKKCRMLFVLVAALSTMPRNALQAAEACDRECLTSLADKLLDSIAAHKPDSLPLTPRYAATENSVASALNMMVIWRTATSLKQRFYIVDPFSSQLFLETTISEGPSDTFVFGRIKADGARIAEIELYENRSRGQGGFQFGPEGAANLPAEWTQTVAANRIPKREQLLSIGHGMFDSTIDGPDSSPDCVLMENGKDVAENAAVAAKIGGGGAPEFKPKGKASIPNADGTVPIPCGAPKGRPTDPLARTTIIDERQGIVVSMAVVQGVAEPYLATAPTESAFVPLQMLKPYTDMLKAQEASSGKKVPAIVAMKAAGATSQVERIYDGKLQGMQLLVNIGAPGSHSPWVTQ